MTEEKRCPLCGSARVAPILYGKPLLSEELEEKLRREEAYLGGCAIPPNAPRWHCFACGGNVDVDPRARVVRRWIDMWLQQRDLGIDEIFAEDVIYTESWGPEYRGAAAVRHWFQEWNTRGRVVCWEIRRFWHQDDRTAAEWFFRCEMRDGHADEFEGVTLIEWTPDRRIRTLKEFGCSVDRYDPYAAGPEPRFRGEDPRWF